MVKVCEFVLSVRERIVKVCEPVMLALRFVVEVCEVVVTLSELVLQVLIGGGERVRTCAWKCVNLKWK